MADRLDSASEHARQLLQATDLEGVLPTRDHPRSAAVEWARSGAMALTGWPDGPPEFAPGALASAASGAVMALQAIAPQAGFQSLDAPALLGERAAIAGLSRQGDVSAGGSARLLATSRGSVVLNLPREEDWQLIPALLETNRKDLAANQDWRVIAELVATRDPQHLVERGRIMGLAIAQAAPAQTATSKAADHQPFFDVQHATGISTPEWPPRATRLLDLSSLWAGPLATSLLASAGIEVLKIESPTRPDGARHGPAEFFDLMNGNKQGCALDLQDPRDRSIFEQLLESADIVVESARPRALSQLGFKSSDWVHRRPGRIWASITGYGRAEEWIAFGDDAAVAAGLAWSPNVSSSGPRFCADAIADPLGGLHTAVAVLGLLKKGRGGLLDLSLVDIASYAASIDCDPLVLPVESTPEGWFVIEEGRPFLIENPRSRAADRNAPQLSAPDESLISEWTRPC